jgi:hypothetical protein
VRVLVYEEVDIQFPTVFRHRHYTSSYSVSSGYNYPRKIYVQGLTDQLRTDKGACRLDDINLDPDGSEYIGGYYINNDRLNLYFDAHPAGVEMHTKYCFWNPDECFIDSLILPADSRDGTVFQFWRGYYAAGYTTIQYQLPPGVNSLFSWTSVTPFPDERMVFVKKNGGWVQGPGFTSSVSDPPDCTL